MELHRQTRSYHPCNYVAVISLQTLTGDPSRPRHPGLACITRAPWVLGRGWLYGAFPGGLPTRAQLDLLVPDRPALMNCYDGHTRWLNSKALAAAGITRNTRDPADGVIMRDATGEPTGVLKVGFNRPFRPAEPIQVAPASRSAMRVRGAAPGFVGKTSASYGSPAADCSGAGQLRDVAVLTTASPNSAGYA